MTEETILTGDYNHDISMLSAHIEEIEALNECLSDLLDKTAITLKGKEPELTKWSFHDIPELVAAMKTERDAGLAHIEELREYFEDILECGTTGEDTDVMKDYAKEALAKSPSLSLQDRDNRIRDEAIDDCLDAYRDSPDDHYSIVEAIRNLKGGNDE